MEEMLIDSEVRVLGCLMEKEMATPEYYPLSLNSLVNGCNQKSNRDPVVSYDERTVVLALKNLQENRLVRRSDTARVAKYEQLFGKKYNLLHREASVMCILMLRGPQTIGEIRARTERLHRFDDLEQVLSTLSNLEELELVRRLPRQPGRKESRYMHLLSGEVDGEQVMGTAPGDAPSVIVRKGGAEPDVQRQLDELREEIRSLQEEFAAFRARFE